MKITTQEQVNTLVWTIALILFACMMINVLTDAEIISAITGLVFIGALCLFYVVHRSEPGQQVFQKLQLLPENKFFRWTVLLAGGVVTVDWVWEIGEFLLTQIRRLDVGF